MDLTFHPEATEDIRMIAEKYGKISERVHERFWAELETVIQRVGEFPERHHFDLSRFRRANLKKFPYHILFEITDSKVYIVAVRHDRRNPSFGLDRM